MIICFAGDIIVFVNEQVHIRERMLRGTPQVTATAKNTRRMLLNSCKNAPKYVFKKIISEPSSAHTPQGTPPVRAW